MSWVEKRAAFQQRFDYWSQQNTEALRVELDRAIATFISRGGINQDPINNPDYELIQQKIRRINEVKKGYSDLRDEIMDFLQKNGKHYDLQGLLGENGELQKQIIRLNKVQDQMKVDVESAIARDELLRSRESNINSHELFLFGRPVRKGMIPYLWVLSILLIGVSLIIFRNNAPSVVFDPDALVAMVSAFFMDRTILISILVAAIVIIIVLSLQVAGVFGN